MIGTRTTVIAPVGPLTWTRLPPKTAASTPATIAVIGPAIPELRRTPARVPCLVGPLCPTPRVR